MTNGDASRSLAGITADVKLIERPTKMLALEAIALSQTSRPWSSGRLQLSRDRGVEGALSRTRCLRNHFVCNGVLALEVSIFVRELLDLELELSNELIMLKKPSILLFNHFFDQIIIKLSI